MISEDLATLTKKLDELEADALVVVNEIKQHTLTSRDAMGDDKTPADTYTLSNELVELALCNSRLSERVAEAGFHKRAGKAHHELIREEHKSRLVRGYVNEAGETVEGIGVGLADSEKIKLSIEEAEHSSRAEKVFDQLNLLYKSTNTVIDAIRTKISYEKVNERNA